MFTGIVEALGSVVALDKGAESAQLNIRGDNIVDVAAGDSIAVNGVCLTATDVSDATFRADVMLATLDHTTLGDLEVGAPVNLERAATLTSRLGGHLVQGHVDGVAAVVDRRPGEAWELVTVEVPAELMRYVVDKGSIALDGVSLTVAESVGERVTVSLIPETLRRTTLGTRAVGERVNVEVDVLAKHVERLLAYQLEKR